MMEVGGVVLMVTVGQTFYKVKGEDSCEGIVERHGGALDMRQL